MNEIIIYGGVAVSLIVGMCLIGLGNTQTNYEEDSPNYDCYEQIARQECAERGEEFSHISTIRQGFICSPDAREGYIEHVYYFLPEDDRRCGG